MAKRKHKHSKYKNTGLFPIVSCTDCENCLYIGEGDSMCGVYHIIVIDVAFVFEFERIELSDLAFAFIR